MRIVISGTTGIGKSTTTKVLVKELTRRGYKVNHLSEKVVNNIFLKYFFKKPEKWVFLSQVNFLMERLTQYLVAEENRNNDDPKEIIVYDRHVLDDLIFSKLSYVREHATEDEMKTYEHLYKNVMKRLQQDGTRPTYTLMLKTDFEIVMDRLRKRNRADEVEANQELWEELYDAYYIDEENQKHLKENSETYKVLEIEEKPTDAIVKDILNLIGIKK